MVRLLTFLLAFTVALPADEVADRVASIAAESTVARRGFWGAMVTELDTGRVVYEHNAEKLFVPASNIKLFTTALALTTLGPDHRTTTQIVAATEPDEEGVVKGDLVIVGGGDPSLSGRHIPYRKEPSRKDVLGPFKELADRIVAAGVRRVTGDIVGDDSAYVWEPYPEGWAQEDLQWEYGAPVSALTIHDNSLRLSILPGTGVGEPARLRLKPPVEYYEIRNRVKTAAEGETRVHMEWPHGSREIFLWGFIKPRTGRAKLLAIRDPAHYAAWVMADLLRERGVAIDGEPRAEHLWMHEVTDFRRGTAAPPREGVVLVERESPEIIEILKIVIKDSQNLHAELMLREVGRVQRHIGSRAAGLAELKDLLVSAGIATSEYHIEDGSGLSRMNLVTPAAVAKLLTHMYLSTERDGWLDLMAIGGEDGTLHYRFKTERERGRVLAKTGTLTGASALSGYLQREDGTMLAFSVMVNNYNTTSGPARQFLDRLVGAFVE